MNDQSSESNRLVWLRFLCLRGSVRRTARNEQFFAPLEATHLVMRTLGGHWRATPLGIERHQAATDAVRAAGT